MGGFPGSGFPSGAWFSGLIHHPQRLSPLAPVALVSMHTGKSLLAFPPRQHGEVAAEKGPSSTHAAQPGLAVQVRALLMSLIGYKCTLAR